MKNILTITLLLFLASCDYFGQTRNRTIADITNKLKRETEGIINIHSNINLFNLKSDSYQLSKENIVAKPVIYKDIIYFLDEVSNVSAYSIKNKKHLWSMNLESDSIVYKGGLSYSDGKLYVTTGADYLFILDANTGHEIIRRLLPSISQATPLIHNEMIFVQTIDNKILAYNTISSQFSWISEASTGLLSIENNITPLIYKDSIIVNFTSGLLCLDIKTGNIKWEYVAKDSLDHISTPNFDIEMITSHSIIKDEYIYFATSNGILVKLDLNNGKSAWVRDADGVQTVNLLADHLFITNNARQIAVLDEHSGKVIWTGELIDESKKVKRIRATTFQKPFIVKDNQGENILYILSSKEIYRFTNEDGTFQKQSLLKANEKIKYILNEKGVIYIIGNKTIRF